MLPICRCLAALAKYLVKRMHILNLQLNNVQHMPLFEVSKYSSMTIVPLFEPWEQCNKQVGPIPRLQDV